MDAFGMLNMFQVFNDPRVSDAEIIDKLVTALEAVEKYPDEIKSGWVQEILIMAKYRRGDYAWREEMRPHHG